MLARWGLGLCLDHQYVCQGDEHAGPLERKLQRVPKVATRLANCQLPIGREEHRAKCVPKARLRRKKKTTT